MNRICIKLILTGLLLTGMNARSETQDFHWNGFVAQGLIQSDNSNFVNDDGDISLRLTEIGLNASYRLNSRLRVAGQLMYLNGGHRYDEGTRLDFLFLDWQLASSLDWQVNLHLGRYKNYHWLYSSTRDVPHTRPSIILPQSVYVDIFRDVSLGADGAALQVKHNNSAGEWELNWSYGEPDVGREQGQNLISTFTRGELKVDSDHQMSLIFRPYLSQWQFGGVLLNAKFDYRSTPEDFYVDGSARTQRLMLNALYSAENYELAAEYMRERVTIDELILPGFVSDLTGEGGFVQMRYFLNSAHTLMARVDLYDRSRDSRSGKFLSDISGGVIPPHFGYMDTLTLGWSWDIAPKWRLQSEFHRAKGRGRLAPLVVPDLQTNAEKYWNIWAIQVMHWF